MSFSQFKQKSPSWRFFGIMIEIERGNYICTEPYSFSDIYIFEEDILKLLQK